MIIPISKYNKKEQNNMQTPQALIDATIEKVRRYLDETAPDYLAFDSGAFTITYGSTQIMVIVRPFTDADVCVECIANVVSGATISTELLRYLLRKNAELHFGAFGLLFDDTIVFSHSLNGSNLDKNELATSLQSVAVIADYYDDEIVEMAGGKRAADISGDDNFQ